MRRETVVVLDFGGQYNQLIARRVRECNVYCEIYSYKTDIEKIKEINPKGIIFTGGPNSCYEPDAPTYTKEIFENVYCEIYSYKTDIEKIKEINPKGIIFTGGPNSCYEPDAPTYTKEIFELGIPVLGICYGSQLMMHLLGGKVEKAPVREYGKIEVNVDNSSKLFSNVSSKTICWMSHNDYISSVAPDFSVSAWTADCPVAAVENPEKNGSQLMMHLLGGKVEKAPVREYGKIEVNVDNSSKLFSNVSSKTICWMSHNDYISSVAPDFSVSAWTADCPVAAVENPEKKLYAVQFHPEVLHTQEGTKMLSNFVYNVCGCAGEWKMDSFVEESIKSIREKVGDGKVLCALSGGVDSSVAAVLLSKAVGNQLTCVFVDHGLLRKNEGDEVDAVF